MQTVTERIIEALRKRAHELDRETHFDLTVKVNDGQVTLLEPSFRWKP